MALVLLPCDLPTWPTVQRHLNQLKQAVTTQQLLEGMLRLHNLCCVGLDPDEDSTDPDRFDGLQKFLDTILTENERQHFFDVTLPSLITSALRLKSVKPVSGLQFSLQQQADHVALERHFALSLVANAFFSTFPKRTQKTHPTLQDFNFSQFFMHLDRCEQQAKLKSILYYYDQAITEPPEGHITFSRQVIPKWDRPSIDDWLCCSRPLCPLVVRHEGHANDADIGAYQICFASCKVGGSTMSNGYNEEELVFCSCPELLVTMLCVERLEDNESLSAHNWMRMGTIPDGKRFHPMESSVPCWDTHMSLIDANDYGDAPRTQFHDQSLLRELTKAYVGFQQPKTRTRLSPIGQSCSSTPPERSSSGEVTDATRSCEQIRVPNTTVSAGIASLVKAALSPGGRRRGVHQQQVPNTHHDSSKGALKDLAELPPSLGTYRKAHPSTLDSGVGSQEAGHLDSVKLSEKLSLLTVPEVRKLKKNFSDTSELSFADALSTQTSFCSVAEDEIWCTPTEPLAPVKITDMRPLVLPTTEGSDKVGSEVDTSRSSSTIVGRSRGASLTSGDNVSDDEDDYQSCSEDVDTDDRTLGRLPGPDLVSSTGRRLFAECLRGAVRRSCSSQSEMEDSNYSLDIHIAGPDVRDREEIHVRRVPSTGFLLEEDDCFVGDALEAEQAWLRQFRQRSASHSVSRCNSSRYSFSSDFSSDLEDIYEHFEEMMKEGPVADDPAVAKYVGGLLKRTLSDSLTASRHRCGSATSDLMPRSLSLADHLTQERLALEQAKRQRSTTGDAIPSWMIDVGLGDRDNNGQNLSGQLGLHRDSRLDLHFDADGYRPIATGNWGCGSKMGDPQLKAVVQWLAASRAEAPYMIYYTAGNKQLVKLDTVGRVLLDRHWTVGNLMKVVLKYCRDYVECRPSDNLAHNLFDTILPNDWHQQTSWASAKSHPSQDSLD